MNFSLIIYQLGYIDLRRFESLDENPIELSKEYRNKKVEIAENYYYVTGETMSILKKSIQLWKGRNIQRSEASYKSMSESLKEADSSNDEVKDRLFGQYRLAKFDLCSQYDTVYAILANDIDIVKTNLLATFKDN